MADIVACIMTRLTGCSNVYEPHFNILVTHEFMPMEDMSSTDFDMSNK
jgi:hypothetical protein